jgi:outer membrane murein-binding lipoprotein Lpp
MTPMVGVLTFVLVVGALAGCAGQEQSGKPAAQVSTWVSGAGGGVAIGTLEVDSRNIDLAVSSHDPSAALRTVCALLTNDAQTAIGNLPTPDTQLTNDLNTAYEDAAAAGDDCYRGSLRRSAAERIKLMPLLATAVDRISAITGHSPSTSTTQPPAGGSDPFGN